MFVKKVGHRAARCCQSKEQNSKKERQSDVQSNLVEGNEVIVVVVVEENLVANKIDWVLDTSASRHFCANKELFNDFEESTDGERVYMGNSTTVVVMGKGKFLLKLTSGMTLSLNNVLYVPSVRRNLVSGALLDKVALNLCLKLIK